MSSCSVILAVLLFGQVGATNDRYGTTGQALPPDTTIPAGDDSANGLVDRIAPPPDAAQSTIAPSSRASDPYAPANIPSRGSSPQTLPSDVAAPSQQTASPPPGYGYQTQPTSQAGAAAPTGQSPGLKPSAMMRAMLTPPQDSRLAGQPMTLEAVVASAASRAEQTQRVETYWDLCSSVADYYLGLREQEELRRLRSLVPTLGPAGQQAENELAVRVGTSHRAAVASQYRLASWIGPSTGLPLPSDTPHCGSYHTHYQEIFAGRTSVEAQELSALLPLRYTELKDAAAAVTRAEEWLNQVAAARSNTSDTTGTLRALELLALRRRAFVQIVRDYNRRIARYSELATPGQIDANRLIGMLIKRDSSSTATRPFAPAAPPNRQSQNRTSLPPSTFSEGWAPVGGMRTLGSTRDEAVQPASAVAQPARRQERSLLVPHR